MMIDREKHLFLLHLSLKVALACAFVGLITSLFFDGISNSERFYGIVLPFFLVFVIIYAMMLISILIIFVFSSKHRKKLKEMSLQEFKKFIFNR